MLLKLDQPLSMELLTETVYLKSDKILIKLWNALIRAVVMENAIFWLVNVHAIADLVEIIAQLKTALRIKEAQLIMDLDLEMAKVDLVQDLDQDRDQIQDQDLGQIQDQGIATMDKIKMIKKKRNVIFGTMGLLKRHLKEKNM